MSARRTPSVNPITDAATGPRPEAVAARAEGLRYTSDHDAGYRRIRRGKSFNYLDPDGTRVTDARVLARIRCLALPPA
jgi:DNA topoisomerase IB